MKQRPLRWNVVKDECGTALTEFVIVIPVMLLFFFVFLQYFSNLQASQLGNYAAYMAARVYAVRASLDANDAADKATTAACMVLAPIAGPQPGEMNPGGLGAGLNLGPLETLIGSSFGRYAIGYGMAQFRFSAVLGGSITNTVGGTPQQVNCLINYPQPIFVPGLAGLWDLVTGERIYHSLSNSSTGLGGMPGATMPAFSDLDVVFEGIEAANPQSRTRFPSTYGILPYINIQSKCSTEYSSWGGESDYVPRMPANPDDTDSSGTSTNGQGPEQALQQSVQDQSNYTNALANAKTACQNLCTADQNLANAHAKDDPIINNPKNYTAGQVAAAQQDLQGYVSAQQTAAGDNSQAQSQLNSAQQAVENDTKQSVPGMPCGCN